MHERKGNSMVSHLNEMKGNSRGQPLARYAAWRRVGDYIFMSGVIPVDPTAGLIVRSYADIPAEARTLIGQTGEFSTDAKEGPILAQARARKGPMRSLPKALHHRRGAFRLLHVQEMRPR
jgi:hypothetical protein